MWLVVGLGNPGTRYAQNRHNIGFMAAEAISAAYSFGGWQKKFHGKISEGKIPLPLREGAGGGGLFTTKNAGVDETIPPHLTSPARGGEQKVLLLLPETYMNESGRAVQAACTFHKIAPERVIVLQDEIELTPGKIRVKQGGGHGGHNGLKSIDAAIGQNYWRVRLGVGRPPKIDSIGRPPNLAPAEAGVENGERMDTADYVLSNFTTAEKKWLAPFLKSVAQYFPLLLSGQPSEFMNRITLAKI